MFDNRWLLCPICHNKTEGENQWKHHIKKLPPLLPEMQK